MTLFEKIYNLIQAISLRLYLIFNWTISKKNSQKFFITTSKNFTIIFKNTFSTTFFSFLFGVMVTLLYKIIFDDDFVFYVFAAELPDTPSSSSSSSSSSFFYLLIGGLGSFLTMAYIYPEILNFGQNFGQDLYSSILDFIPYSSSYQFTLLLRNFESKLEIIEFVDPHTYMMFKSEAKPIIKSKNFLLLNDLLNRLILTLEEIVLNNVSDEFDEISSNSSDTLNSSGFEEIASPPPEFNSKEFKFVIANDVGVLTEIIYNDNKVLFDTLYDSGFIIQIPTKHLYWILKYKVTQDEYYKMMDLGLLDALFAYEYFDFYPINILRYPDAWAKSGPFYFHKCPGIDYDRPYYIISNSRGPVDYWSPRITRS